MIIKVTQQHIDLGCRYIAEFCPVALALMEAMGGRWQAGTTKASEYAEDMCMLKTGQLPDEVCAWIETFDRSASKSEIQPFEFEFTCKEND